MRPVGRAHLLACVAAVSGLSCPVLVAAVDPGVVLADGGARAESALELPPDPDSLAPALAAEVHLSLVFPVANGAVCPDEAGCVFAAGGGVGASLERRWPFGVALGLAYDVWFLDSSGVFELGVLQELRAQVRYLALRDSRVHPFLGLGAGALIFGDTVKVSTLGFAMDAMIGVEVEVTEAFSLVASMPWRVFRTAPFTTPRDRVDRAEDGGLNAAVSIQLGLSVVETP